MYRLMTAIVCGSLLAVGVAQAGSEETLSVELEIEEWDVPFDGARSRDPWVGGDDLIWFCWPAFSLCRSAGSIHR